MQLDCVAQNYAWGIKGEQSAVARFKRASDEAFDVSSEESYAELWMGTHPSGPSKLVKDGTLLADWLNDKPQAVGVVPAEYPANNLPFLFKVLSVQTALSVQAHPDKNLAKQLHEKFPSIYKDPNHKPEMVIALTPFECMCGFRTIADIAQNLVDFPEFVSIIDHSPGSKLTEDVADAERNNRTDLEEHLLRRLLNAFMYCPAELAAEVLLSLVGRLAGEQTARALTPLEALVMRLYDQYPGDVGVFSPLLMNYLCLQPGQSFFIGANELHAYVSGECVECMALSDNVVRAGLTPKFKDVETLVNMVIYKARQPDFLTPIKIDDHTSLYRPPLDGCAEFEVELIEVPANTAAYRPPVLPCGAVLLLFKAGSAASSAVLNTQSGAEGSELDLKEGAVVFTAAGQDVTITTGAEGATFYRAHVNLTGTA